MKLKNTAIILVFAFIGWALCGAVMGIGLATMSVRGAEIVHAIAAPVIFTRLSLVYFNRYAFTSPLQTALVFTGFIVSVDFFLVALVINRSLEMFASPLGTWVPFVLIFLSTYATGRYATAKKGRISQLAV